MLILYIISTKNSFIHFTSQFTQKALKRNHAKTHLNEITEKAFKGV